MYRRQDRNKNRSMTVGYGIERILNMKWRHYMWHLMAHHRHYSPN